MSSQPNNWLTLTTDVGKDWRVRADMIESYWPTSNYSEGPVKIRTVSGHEMQVRESMAAIATAFETMRVKS